MWAESGQVPHVRCVPSELTNNSMCTKHYIYEEILVTTQQTVISGLTFVHTERFIPEASESSVKTLIFVIYSMSNHLLT